MREAASRCTPSAPCSSKLRSTRISEKRGYGAWSGPTAPAASSIRRRPAANASAVMDVLFVEEHDPHVNPLGVKGVGEIAMVGVAPAITNAIFHATGRRPQAAGHAGQAPLKPPPGVHRS